MTTIEVILLMLGTGLMNTMCFFIGAKVGQKVIKGEEIKLPSVNPINVVKNYEEKREEEKRNKEYRDNLEAINNYNGNI